MVNFPVALLPAMLTAMYRRDKARNRNGEATMIECDQQICHDFETACGREWLETKGIGGFASSTTIGLNTRRYHGLLAAATKPPVGRLLLLSKLEETLVLDGQRFEPSCTTPAMVAALRVLSVASGQYWDRAGESGAGFGATYGPPRMNDSACRF